MKTKFFALSLVIAVLSITCSTSSLAYLVDVDSSNATFATGQVKVRTLTASIGRGTNVTDNDIIASAESYATYLQDNCMNMLGGSTCNKYIFVKNTGSSNAYVRVRILVPESLVTGASPIITLNKDASGEYAETTQTGVYCNGTSGDLCTEYKFTRTAVLPAGVMTTSSVINSITYNDVIYVDSNSENVETASTPIDLTQSNIRIRTEAIQAQGFESASQAFANFN